MGPQHKNRSNWKNLDKRFLSKNKTIKLYKEKANKINLYKKEVELLTQKYDQIDAEKIEKFDDFPLSDRTKRGLKQCGYFTPTQIQKETILLSLKENDILGAAKTGSGKTLAFVIPVLERLYVSGWSILDGLGVLIITPTRELAYQIYEVINKIGSYHQFSVGLIIGGKDLAKERKLLDKCNIMICTPGRLLQHMDENPLLDTMNMKLLILDEADRILDLGFAKTMNAILENLPQERQTLLFSATQTKSVKDLARLSLKNPKYVSVDEHAKYTTPEALQQSFIVCEAHDKMNLLWSFIKSHKKQKILVFMSSCKQVKFTFESICRLRPGVSIMALYGSLHQLKRMQIYDEFCKKNHVVMIATDIASRGLDFPNVNWVVQLDCPEDVNTYIHRAGRTARYQKGGESLLILLPSEKESMVKQLEERKIPIEEIKANPNKLYAIQRKLNAILLRDKNLKESGVRCFKAYLKNIYLMKDKSVFDVSKVDVSQYANSLGLNFVPRIRFLEKHVEGYKNLSVKENSDVNELEEVPHEEDTADMPSSIINEENAMKHLHSNETRLKNFSLNCDSESNVNTLLPMEKTIIISDTEEVSEEITRTRKPLSKAALVKKALKQKSRLNTITKFDEDGNPLKEVGGQFVPDVTANLKRQILTDDYSFEKANILLGKGNEIYKELYRGKIKSKHREERLKKKAKRYLDKPSGAPPTLNDAENETDKEESEKDIDPNNMSASESDEDSDVHADEEKQIFNKQHLDRANESAEDSEEHSIEDHVNRRQFLNKTSDDNDTSEDINYKENSPGVENNTSEDEVEYRDSKSVGVKRKKSSNKIKKKKICLEKNFIKNSKRSLEDDEELALHFLTDT